MNDSEHTHTHTQRTDKHSFSPSSLFMLRHHCIKVFLVKQQHSLHLHKQTFSSVGLQSTLYTLQASHQLSHPTPPQWTWSAEHTLHMVSRAYFTHGQQSILYTWSTEHTLHIVCRVYFTHGPHSILYTLQASQGPCHPTPSQWTWSAEHTLHMVSRAYITHGQQSIPYTWSAEHTSAEHTLHMVSGAYLTHGLHSIPYTLQTSQVLCHPIPLQWTRSQQNGS